MTLFWILLGTLYSTSVLGVYRWLYVRSVKKYLRWKRDNPGEITAMDYNHGRRYGVANKYANWFKYERDHIPWLVAYAVVWPLWGVFKGIAKVARPKVSLPDYEKIKELEGL